VSLASLFSLIFYTHSPTAVSLLVVHYLFLVFVYKFRQSQNINAMTTNTPRPHVFYDEIHGVYSSPNAEEMPTFPVPRLGHSFDPLATLRTLWADNRYVFLGAVPLSPRLDTPPFDAIRSYTVVQHTNGRWGLTKDAVKMWHQLENNLINIAKIVETHRKDLWVPMDSRYPLLPHKFGYGVTHISEKGAKLALHKSRAAYFTLMAWIFFIVMGVREYEGQCRAWLEETLLSGGLSHDDVGAICNSELIDFSPSYPRAGVIVDHTCRFNSSVRTFIRRGIPVWFYWGDRFSRHTIELFGQYMPKPEELVAGRWCEKYRGPRRVIRHPGVPAAPAAPVTPVAPVEPVANSPPSDGLSDYTASRSPSPAHRLPLPNPGYGQIKGETWREYFDRRAKIRDNVIKNETPKEREKRIQVEEARANFAEPGKKGSPVYRWKRNKDGFWIRTLVTRNEVSDRWQEFTNTQKRFDSILNQWDLCKGLDPDVDVEDDDDEEMYNEYMGVNPEPSDTVSLPPATSSPPVVPSLFPRHIDNSSINTPSSSPFTNISALNSWDGPASWGEEDTFEMVSVSLDHDDTHNLDGVKPDNSLLSMLSLRFGFILPVSQLPSVPDVFDWALIRKIMGDTNAAVGTRLIAPISNFVCNRINNLPVPEQLCDLSLASPDPFTNHINSLQLIKSSAAGVPQYMLVTRDANPRRWLLGLNDPVTLLQSLRLDIDSMSNLARYLFSNGIPFHTYIPASQLPHAYPEYPPVALSYRPLGHRPRISEYAVYENARHLLLSRPYGRAALLQGGMVWRLALDDFEHKEDAEYSVLLGPSEYVSVYQHVLRADDGQRFYDDGLSDTELDLICGVYKVATG